MYIVINVRNKNTRTNRSCGLLFGAIFFPEHQLTSIHIASCRCKNPKMTNSYCWWFRNPAHQLRLVVHPVIYRVLFMPGGAGFLPSTVLIHLIDITDHNPTASSIQSLNKKIFKLYSTEFTYMYIYHKKQFRLHYLKTNMSPENRPSETGNSYSNHHFYWCENVCFREAIKIIGWIQTDPWWTEPGRRLSNGTCREIRSFPGKEHPITTHGSWSNARGFSRGATGEP